MSKKVNLSIFRKSPGVVIDARSPSEFKQGHIPGSLNLPLLDDDERALIGTTYKTIGRDAAVEQGFDLVGPRFGAILRRFKAITEERSANILCWRGGMRSETLAWILQSGGIKTAILQGGYKTFRNYCLDSLLQTPTIHILGGLTGCGKTDLLHELARSGEQTLDLEGLASHRGSTYGGIGMPEQPSTEQFENSIALILEGFSNSKPTWIEDESRLVGRCAIPLALYQAMKTAPFYLVEKTMNERLEIIERDYGKASYQDLAIATERITKRLGGARTKQALAHLSSGHFRKWVEVVLEYYDKSYQASIKKRDTIIPFCLKSFAAGRDMSGKEATP